MCETKRVAWRPEVPEHAQMGSIGGIKGQFWVCEGPRPSGTQNKMIWSKKIREKRGFWPQIGPECPQNGLKGVHWAGIQGQFLVLKVPDHLGTDKNDLEQKKLRKNAFFFTTKSAFFFAHKLGQNGVHWGVYTVNFGVLRVPDPLGVEIMQKKIEKKIWPILAEKDLEKFLAWAQKLNQNRPKWAQ